MSYVITPFEVAAKALGRSVRCRFVHLLSGIATRHSDTIDCTFLVEGQKVMVAISCAALADVRAIEKKQLSDQQLAEIAALFLRQTLEGGYDPAGAELFVGGEAVRALARDLKFL